MLNPPIAAMEQLTNRDRIDLFLDGALPAEERPALFAALASSDELQAEFYQAYTIRIAALGQAQHLVPPPALTARILASAAPPQPVARIAKSLWHSIAARTTVAVVGAIVIGFVTGRLTAPLPVEQHSVQSAFRSAPIHSSPIPSATVAAPQAAPRNWSHTPSRVPAAPVTGSPLDTALHADASRASPITLSTAEQLPTLLARHSMLAPRAPSIGSSPLRNTAPLFETYTEAEQTNQFVFGIRRTSTVMLRQAQLVQPIASTPLANTIASIEYRQRNVGIVIQAGQEQFPIFQVHQSPTGVQSYVLEQQLWWIGAGMRVYLPRSDDNLLLSSFRPVAGILLGTSAYGVLGRAEIGIVWELLPHVGVQCLLEGMVHSHGIGSQWEHAEKLSASIGLAVRF